MRETARRGRWSGALVGFVLAIVAFGPVLAHRGYVLVVDMVFLPRPPLGAGLLGLAGTVPRAVPSDLLAALASHVLPADIVQKLVLVGILVISAAGGARLLAERSAVARLTAAVVLAWNPFVAERLALGQWAVLLGYAAEPWVVVHAARLRRSEPGSWAALILWLALAAATPTGGLVATGTALLVLVVGAAARWRRAAAVTAASAMLNAPWLVPGLLRPRGLPGSAMAVGAFAARSDTPLGVLGSVLTLGGAWSRASHPAGRDAAGLVPITLLIAAAVLVGLVLLLRGTLTKLPAEAAAGLAVTAAVAVVVALAGATPGLQDGLKQLFAAVPAAGLLRDGPRHLAPLAVLEAAALGLAAELLVAHLPRRLRPGGLALSCLPVLVLPGLAWGLQGRLVAVQYPSSWGAARAAVAADRVPGAVLSLPLSAYRAPAWNGRRTVLDPATKAFARRVIADDRLRVGRLTLPAEDPLLGQVEAVLRARGALTQGLEGIGVRWVLVEGDDPPASSFAGARLVVSSRELNLWQLPAPAHLRDPSPPVPPVVVADIAALALVLAAAVSAITTPRRPRHRPRHLAAWEW